MTDTLALQDCPTVAQLAIYFSGGLDEELEICLEQHIFCCSWCQAATQEIAYVAGLLEAEEPLTPPFTSAAPTAESRAGARFEHQLNIVRTAQSAIFYQPASVFEVELPLRADQDPGDSDRRNKPGHANGELGARLSRILTLSLSNSASVTLAVGASLIVQISNWPRGVERPMVTVTDPSGTVCHLKFTETHPFCFEAETVLSTGESRVAIGIV